MMRPPRIRTDIANLPPSARFLLLPARRDLDLGLLPLLAVDVEVLLLQLRDGCLREIVAVRALRGLLDRLELQGDLRRPRVRLLVHDPDAEPVRPDERVDLVHLPGLVASEQS